MAKYYGDLPCTDRKYHSYHGKRIQVCLWTVVELWKTNRKGIIT
ncbi:MAG: hypothetical protein ACLTX3_08525 [Lachnospiraceae bacterium]